MPRLLRNLKIHEVSSVTRGAGEGVRILLRKADFSEDDRKRLADSGAAMPDGSFPIRNAADLENAVRAVGRAKNGAEAKAHIRARARALGLTDKLPDSWASKAFALVDEAFEGMGAAVVAKDGSVDFDGAYATVEAAEALQGVMGEIDEAVMALRRSFCSIMDDPDLADKQGAFATSFEQFKEHLAGLAPDGMEKAVVAAAASRLKASNGENDMTPEQISAAVKKAVDEQIAPFKKANEDQAAKIAKLEADLVVEKLSAEHKDAMSGMSDADKAKWLAMSADERDAQLKTRKTKLSDADADMIRKVEESPVFKAQQAELEKVKKALKDRADADELRKAEDRAVELGLPKAHGAVMLKAYAGDKAAIKEHERAIESLSRLAKEGSAFSAFAQNGGGDVSPDSPLGKVNKRVDELQAEARAAGKGMTRDQAIAKLATSDPKLFREYRAELNKNPAAAATAH